MPAGAVLNAGVAANGTEPEMSVPTGMARSEAVVTLPSDGKDGAMSAEMEEAANNDNSQLDSPVFLQFGLGRGRLREVEVTVEEEREPVCDENGQPLEDDDGNYFFAEPGWRVIRDQLGRVCWDSDGHLCLEELDEDWLALPMKEVPRPAPESLLEQVQRLQAALDQSQMNLEQSQFVHQSDVEQVQQMLAQSQAQNQADRQAMASEMDKRQMEYQKLIRAQKEEKAANDEKWATWMQWLQTDQAKMQKGATDDFTRRIAELEQQRVDQDVQYGELQQKLHISESVAQSKTLYQAKSVPSLTVRAPPPSLPYRPGRCR